MTAMQILSQSREVLDDAISYIYENRPTEDELLEEFNIVMMSTFQRFEKSTIGMKNWLDVDIDLYGIKDPT